MKTGAIIILTVFTILNAIMAFFEDSEIKEQALITRATIYSVGILIVASS